jgi:hypothetical protein
LYRTDSAQAAFNPGKTAVRCRDIQLIALAEYFSIPVGGTEQNKVQGFKQAYNKNGLIFEKGVR